jgi:hypothetical protein
VFLLVFVAWWVWREGFDPEESIVRSPHEPTDGGESTHIIMRANPESNAIPMTWLGDVV